MLNYTTYPCLEPDNKPKESDNKPTEHHYIYLIQPVKYKNTNIYKIGRTCQPDMCRVNQYGRNSQLILQIVCEDCFKAENYLLQLFKFKYKLVSGREFFEGDCDKMKNDICTYICEQHN